MSESEVVKPAEKKHGSSKFPFFLGGLVLGLFAGVMTGNIVVPQKTILRTGTESSVGDECPATAAELAWDKNNQVEITEAGSITESWKLYNKGEGDLASLGDFALDAVTKGGQTSAEIMLGNGTDLKNVCYTKFAVDNTVTCKGATSVKSQQQTNNGTLSNAQTGSQSSLDNCPVKSCPATHTLFVSKAGNACYSECRAIPDTSCPEISCDAGQTMQQTKFGSMCTTKCIDIPEPVEPVSSTV